MAQAWSPAAHDREDQLHVGGIGILMLGNAYQNGSGQCPMSPAALQKLAPSESPQHGLGNNRNHKPAAKVVQVPGDKIVSRHSDTRAFSEWRIPERFVSVSSLPVNRQFGAQTQSEMGAPHLPPANRQSDAGC